MASVAFRNDNSGFQGRDIYGAVHTTFNLPPKRRETPPCPSAYIPFNRDSDFVERGTILNRIAEKCAVGGSRTALVGLGGVGKSQLAIEHCYRTAEQSPETWVFWVHASNAARIEQGYRDIADQVKLEGRDDRQTDIFKLVHDWLRDEKHGRWLLVLDSADDAKALILPAATAAATQAGPRDDIPPRSVLSHLPWSKNGSVLVTSRTKSVARQLVEEDDILAVQPMDMASGTELLGKKLGVEVDKNGVSELAAALEFIPLALVQAASYIQQRAPRCSVQRYIEEFRRIDEKRTGLLDYGGGHLRRDREAKNSILLTWQISFDYILHARPSAADLLSLMSFFDRQGIPEVLLRRGSRNVANVNSVSDSEASIDDRIEEDTGFEEDILMLRNYSFIKTTAETTTFEMHRLVQLATRKWLEEHGQLETWKQQYIYRLCSVFPTGKHENWTECQALFPHAKSALSQPPQSQESRQQWALLLYNAAWYAWQKGNIGDADEFSRKSMEARRKILGPEHVDTLSSTAMAGIAATLAGRWKEAEELEVQVMETSVRVLGEEHPDTLTSIGNLASTYRNQGRWKEAEELEVQVMKTRMRVLGEEHPSTLMSMNNLASTYWNQGRWKEAEELNVQVMETSVRVLGEEHPDTLMSIGNLASTYMNQGRWKEAEELEVQVMETRMRVLGEEHPDTLMSMNNLALTYMNQGRWKEAEELNVQVMKTRKRVLGEEHPSTLMSMNNLASTYRNQGRWKEAEELNVQVMETSVRVLGEEHPDTLMSMNNLASTYRNQGRWKEAEELNVQVMETSVRVLGEEHPDTLMSMNNLALTYMNQGRWKEAEELEVQVMETSVRVLGEEHPHTLMSISNLASTYWNQGRWKEAEKLNVQVMETRMRVLGEEHPSTLTSIGNLASTYRNQGRWKEAEKLNVQVMETRMRVLGEEHPNTLTSIANLASTYTNQGRWKEAEAMTRKTLAQREKVLGPQHPDTLMSVYSLAYLLAKQRFYIESSTLYERACAGYDTKLGEDHPTTRACRQHYVEAIAQRNEEQRVDATTPATPDGSIRIHTKKVSKLTRGLAKFGIKSLGDKKTL